MSRKAKVTLILLLASLTMASLGGLAYRIFFLRMVRVPTGGMALTIVPGDRLVVNRAFGDIARGQIVVFKYRDDKESYVARVIGLPGETIQMRGRTVLINGQPLDEQQVFVEPLSLESLENPKEVSVAGSGPYKVFFPDRGSEMSDESIDDASPDTFAISTPFVIPADNFFMMGDNRENSEDSRYRGPVPRQLIWGTTSFIYFSESMNSGEIRSDRLFKKVK